MARKRNRFLKNLLSDLLRWEYLLCLFLSFLFWLLIKLSDNYQSSFTLRAEYLNMPTYKVLVEEPVSDLTVSAETTGWNLLIDNFNDEERIVYLDLSSYNEDKITITTESLLDNLSETLSQDYRLLSVYPSSVFLEFEELIYKTVPVNSNVKLNVLEGFGLPADALITPDSITLSGLASDLEAIQEWQSQDIELGNVSENVEMELMLQVPEKFNLELNVQSVQFLQEVSAVEFFEMEIPISVSNVPDGYRVTLIPDVAMIYFDAFANRIEEIDPEDFKILADFSSVNINSDSEVPLSLVDSSRQSTNIFIQSSEVDFILYEE